MMLGFVSDWRVCGVSAAVGFVLVTTAMADTVTTLSYACERDTGVSVSYLNLGDKSLAVVSAEGHQTAMELVKSGSGARYVPLDQAAPYTWWTENNRGILSYGRSNAESVLLQDCVEH